MSVLAPVSSSAGPSTRRAVGSARSSQGLRYRRGTTTKNASTSTSTVIAASSRGEFAPAAARRARGAVVMRCAPPPSSGAASTDEADVADAVDAGELKLVDPAVLADLKRAAKLEEMEKEKERFTEIADQERLREKKELERNVELEAVAQIQAQLAVKAWDEHSQAEEFVAEAMAKTDEAFEAKGQAEITLKDLKMMNTVLEMKLKSASGEEENTEEAAEEAAAAADADDEEDADEVEKKKEAAEKKKKDAARMKKIGDWWAAEDPALTMDEAVPVIAERIAEAEAAYEKSIADIEGRQAFSAGVAKSCEDCKDLAKAADERCDDAMTLVAESMEAVLVARIAASAAEEEIAALDEKAAKVKGGEVMMTVDEDDVDAEGAEVVEVVGGVDAAAAVKEKEEKKEKKDKKKKEDKKDEKEEKAEKPKVQSSSKQFASKFFSSENDQPASKFALGVGLAIGLGFASALTTPGGRNMITSTAASVSTTFSKGYDSVLSKIPESERKIAEHAMHESHEAGLTDALTLLFTSILAVTLVSKIPGGSPVLGFLLGGAAVGPYTTGLVSHVGQAQVLAEFGVVFLLFNIGLELSYERLQSMAKYIFGMGSAQMVLTTMVGAAIAVGCGLAIPPAVVIGMGLAFSSTAVALQVLQDRGETGARHGRATFSVLLFQDLTVVLVFMLVPLLAGPDAGSITAIGASLAKAIVKTVVAIGMIMAVGRSIIRPIYNRIAKLGKAEVMTATTLFTALGTSLLTQSLGLSMALGAFLAGLLLAETEFHLQVESDIAPFRGLLLGLFFMTVGMQIDPACLFANFGTICACAVGLLAYKMGVMAVCGKMFGLSMLTSLRSGVYVAPGGEFAFVTFGLAASAGLLEMEIVNIINLAVVLTMAGTPLLANLGSQLKNLIKQDKSVASLQAKEGEVDDLSGHVIIAGYGRVGRMIGELLNKELIPFVALDVGAEEVSKGRAADMPVYFGDAGSQTVLHAVGADKASCAVVTMDSPSANYRAVWALHKYYPNVKVYVRAHDIEQGLQLEKAGAKAVVPEMIEPSLQLAAAVLAEMEMSSEDISIAVDNFRRQHIGELQVLAGNSRSGLGYGQPTSMEQLKKTQDEGDVIDAVVVA